LADAVGKEKFAVRSLVLQISRMLMMLENADGCCKLHVVCVLVSLFCQSPWPRLWSSPSRTRSP
jgi:hypothetical protein